MEVDSKKSIYTLQGLIVNVNCMLYIIEHLWAAEENPDKKEAISYLAYIASRTKEGIAAIKQ